MDLDDLYRQALGPSASPYRYQRRLATDGLPEVLDVPTGCGKTPAVLLAWLYRRLWHPDESVRAETPTRLIWCLPLRSLTAQTAGLARAWVDELGVADQVDVHVLMGGEPVPDQEWRLRPGRPAVIVTTLDMALSRALNRGYLASRYAWPIDFALFNDDCHWVFDEVQLMGVALTTSRQLHGLRTALGVPTRHASTWMSATVDATQLQTVDAPDLGTVVELDPDDAADPGLAQRLEAPKRLVRRELDDPKKFVASLAAVVRSEHVEATTTLVVVNSVRHAQEVARLLRKVGTDDAATIELLHSRFRPQDRQQTFERVVAGPTEAGRGMIVVSTQVIEAGVDLSARTLVTECAPWSSVVQRAGRCNRWGEQSDARLVIVPSSGRSPYDHEPVERAWAVAGELHASLVTPGSLAAVRATAPAAPTSVLRRKDLLELFDTAPDLSGNDIDVSRFIRADGDLDVALAWRSMPTDLAGLSDWPPVGREERCAASIGDVRDWFKKRPVRAVVRDPLAQQWRRAASTDVRPGALLVIDAASGGYSSTTGFDPTSTVAVDPVEAASSLLTPDADDGMGADPLTTEVGHAVDLAVHLGDAEAAVASVLDELGVVEPVVRAVVSRAARLHDLGKAHDIFQEALHARSPEAAPGSVLAKSGTTGRLPIPKDRRGFRHELVSAVVLDAHPELTGMEGPMADLVTYLVGAHHGRIRLGLRSLPGEPGSQILGVRDGDLVPEVDLGDGLRSPPTTVRLDRFGLGDSEDQPSWTNRALALLDAHGPFRLAWMEAVLRIADWRASIEEGRS